LKSPDLGFNTKERIADPNEFLETLSMDLESGRELSHTKKMPY